MEMLLNFCYYITLFLIPIAVYVLLFQHRTQNRFYTNRDWFYVIKLLFARAAVKKYQNRCRQSLNEETKKLLENAKEIRSENYNDNHFIYGADQKGNSLSLRFTIESGLVGEVFLCLRLATGATYILTGDKITKLYSLSGWNWKTNDLHIEILEPFKRLRVTFNGLLSNASHDIEHVRFNFIWVAAGAPQFYPQDASTALLTDVLARQTWRDGDWISLLGDEHGYEQFGGLHGFVRGDSFKDDLLLNLPSCRTRFWGSAEKSVLHRSLHLFIAGQDGNLINVWVKSLRKGCNDLQYGSIITSSGKVEPITGTNIRLEHFGQKDTFPSTFLVEIYGAKKVYRTVFHANMAKTVTDSYELSNIPADCDLNIQQAKSLVEFWQGGKNVSSDKAPPPLLTENKTKNLPECYVTAFDDERARIVRLTGGKGCSLALLASMTTDEFVVPDGFIVTVKAFSKQLEVNFNMKKAVAILDDICCGRSKGDLEDACAQTVKTFETEEILPEIKSEVLKALRKVKKNTPIDRYAVRSSAIGEDSEDLSAAGQNATFLGCVTTSDVLQSISLCWASLFTYQSVRYRHQHGLPIPTEMAVVVQRMVPSECAGVLFTCHPSTANPAHIVITSNHGLGESVVSGRSEPDTVILQRTFDNDLTIKSKAIGLKNKVIKMSDEGIVETEGLERFSISDNQALDLGRVGVALEERLGGARDIEWAFSGGRLYLLQARPITTLGLWGDYELLHEFDVATLSEDVVYTVANTGEILPGAISTLTVSSVVRAIDKAIQRSIEGKSDNYALKCLATFQQHLFVDVISGIHLKVNKTIDIVAKTVDLAIFGHPIINERIHSLALNRFGAITPLGRINYLITTIKLAWRNEYNTKLSKTLNKNCQINIDTNRDTLKDMYIKIDKSLDKMADVLLLHCHTTRTSVTYQIFAMTVLAENNTDFTVDHYNDIAMLLGSCDDVISAEIPNILANITKILVESKQADKFAKIDPEFGRKWLKDNAPIASKMFEKFLKDHGHRAMREFDVYNETWGTNPCEVIKMIQTNCRNKGPRQEKTIQPLDDVIAALVSPKRLLTPIILKFLMAKGRKAVGFREQTKSESIRFVDKIRTAYKILGHKMALKGLIPHLDLIFHLSHYEIGLIIDGSDRSPVLVTKALKRQKLYPKWDQLKFPEISYGIPAPEKRDFIPRTGTGKIKCEGTPVCFGVIQARACVISDLSEIDQLREGDVLITYCTDIGWSPYFPMLGGIVTELGGLVSHGAVIAREYGLPCIVGAKGVTKIFKTGDVVILSGKTGTIELV